MANWKEILTHLAGDADSKMDALRDRLSYQLGGSGPVKIIAYRSYGTPERLYLSGRVLEDNELPAADKNDKVWNNLLDFYRRMHSTPVPHARLVVRFQGQEFPVSAGEDGFFEVRVEPVQPLAGQRFWHMLEVELLEPVPLVQSRYPVKVMEAALVPSAAARFGVICDIDGLLLETDPANLLSAARNVFLGGAYNREPFPGITGLLRALAAGETGAEANPLFYISASPWNLYELVAQYFTLQRIPTGPLLFPRAAGRSLQPAARRQHKMDAIGRLLETYPRLPFILIGGQADQEVFSGLLEALPRHLQRQVQAVYARKPIDGEAENKLVGKMSELGCALVLADDAFAIARHAAASGLINAGALETIREDKQKDEAPPQIVEKLIGVKVKTAPAARSREKSEARIGKIKDRPGMAREKGAKTAKGGDQPPLEFPRRSAQE